MASPGASDPPPARARGPIAGPLRALTGSRGVLLGVLAASVAGIAVAVWPLAGRVWGLLGLGAAPSGRAAAAAVCLAAGAAATAGLVRLRRSRGGEPVGLAWVIAGAWAVAALVIAALTAGAWWLLGAPGWNPPDHLTPRALDQITTRAFAVVAGLGGVAFLVIGYRRQRTTEAEDARAEVAAAREDTRLFNERFTDAYTNLGSEHAAVRLGAVHALARLADDAPEGREDLVQMVVDVLCAYLRMPYAPAPPEPYPGADPDARDRQHAAALEFAALREVRHTVVRVIVDHLRGGGRWRDRDYDFTGTRFDTGDFANADFGSGEVVFARAVFTGDRVAFDGTVFGGDRTSFDGAVFEADEVTFLGAVCAGNRTSFNGAVFSAEHTSFDGLDAHGNRLAFDGAVFTGARVSFGGAAFSGDQVSFNGTVFSADRTSFDRARFTGSWVSFGGAGFRGGHASFDGARFTGEWVSFGGVGFADGRATFHRAEFSGDRVSFADADLTGGVSFTAAVLTANRVAFTDGARPARGPCPEGLVDALEAGRPGGAVLPDGWPDVPGAPGPDGPDSEG
ncbi:pentapeptide repeat-containing protein [Nocardiopsis trehalosi]|jgi:hypothetical protein|uniref:pentapeptide repeat-containing protein n=1 Tax=Nocardiopsis trehalosi TaxID=109329 RepID=UPI000830540F|nr:pentapeptide repeat-containing protein [Nocardiopsis trehalosi]